MKYIPNGFQLMLQLNVDLFNEMYYRLQKEWWKQISFSDVIIFFIFILVHHLILVIMQILMSTYPSLHDRVIFIVVYVCSNPNLVKIFEHLQW